jgi:hypothetical protein
LLSCSVLSVLPHAVVAAAATTVPAIALSGQATTVQGTLCCRSAVETALHRLAVVLLVLQRCGDSDCK